MGAVSSTITTTKESVLQLKRLNNFSMLTTVGGQKDFEISTSSKEHKASRRVGGTHSGSGAGLSGHSNGNIQDSGGLSSSVAASIPPRSGGDARYKKVAVRVLREKSGGSDGIHKPATTTTTTARTGGSRAFIGDYGAATPPSARRQIFPALTAEQRRVMRRGTLPVSTEKAPKLNTDSPGYIQSSNDVVDPCGASKSSPDSIRAFKQQHEEKEMRGDGGGGFQREQRQKAGRSTSMWIGGALSKLPLSKLKIVIGNIIDWRFYPCPIIQDSNRQNMHYMDNSTVGTQDKSFRSYKSSRHEMCSKIIAYKEGFSLPSAGIELLYWTSSETQYFIFSRVSATYQLYDATVNLRFKNFLIRCFSRSQHESLR